MWQWASARWSSVPGKTKMKRPESFSQYCDFFELVRSGCYKRNNQDFFFFFLIFCREGMLKWHFLCAVHVSSCQMSTLQSSAWHQVWSERLLHYLTKNSQSLETQSHCVTVCIPPYLFHCYLFSNYSARRIADDNDLCGTDKMLYFIGFFYKLINW